MIENIILADNIDKNEHVAKMYKTQIWEHSLYAQSKLDNKQTDDLILDPKFADFIKESIQFFKNFNVAEIGLYNANGHRILTSNHLTINPPNEESMTLFTSIIYNIDYYFLEKVITQNGLEQAIQGHSTYSLLPYMTLCEPFKCKSINERSVVVSYVPLIYNMKVIAVLELVSDVTDQWDKIGLLAQRVCITFFIMFCVFFIIIIYNTQYAQKIINQQFQVNKLLEEAKAKAEDENSAKTEFLANVSHELRTPLNAIIGFSEMILSEAYGKLENTQYLDYINDINNAGKHLLSVINDILDLSKAVAGKLQVDNIELDLNKIATASMRFVKPRAQNANITLIEKIPKNHIIIVADPKRLKQVLLNLLSNAVKFTPANGSVTLEITTNKMEKLVYIKVIDTGIGISEQDLPEALSSFGQVDNKFNRNYEGSGLGLPLTAKLVTLINGKFEIRSKQGQGTTATLIFQYYDNIETF